MESYEKCLRDLKNWQSNHKKSSDKDEFNNIHQGLATVVEYSDCETEDYFVTGSSSNTDHPVLTIDVYDHKQIIPPKPFELLLEEKLAEAAEPTYVRNPKPKKPFLRKGTGLVRYKQDYPTKLSKTKVAPNSESLKNLKVNNKRDKPDSPRKVSFPETSEYTPLKPPDAAIKTKAKWSTSSRKKDVFLEVRCSPTKILCQDPYETPRAAKGDGLNALAWMAPESVEKKCDISKVNTNPFNSVIINKINEFAKRNFGRLSPRKSLDSSKEKECNSNTCSVDSDSPKEDKDLKIFEALEKRAENSSFCSTNSSVLRILSSTPSKGRNETIFEDSEFFSGSSSPLPNGKHELENKLKLLDEKTEVINNFISKLRMIKHNDSDDSRQHDLATETEVFSEEEAWPVSDYPSCSTSPEKTYNATLESQKMTETCVNTSFPDVSNMYGDAPCSQCEYKSLDISKNEKFIDKLKKENVKLLNTNIILRREKEEMNRQMKKIMTDFETERGNYQLEIDDLKKKLQKEKIFFENYKRNIQNTRKEQEEMANLKQEVIETKELLKLKEAKHGTTQARLRSQLKLTEKENGDLKLAVEKLTRENAKLTLNQKLSRRPSDTKILHDINKSLAKLTEETLKSKTAGNLRSNSANGYGKTANRTTSVKTVEFIEKDNVNELSTESFETTNFESRSLEKQYENVFGSTLPPQNISLNDSKKEKTETVLEDGSKEIKYSNGNIKTISADGNLIAVKYYNGDIKEADATEKTVKYFYSNSNTWHTTYDDGTEYIEFPSGQAEKKYLDGRCEVYYSDGVIQTKYPEGKEEVKYTDGSVLSIDKNGMRTLMLPNGQKEIHTHNQKRREYPDGTVKILYPDGTQETRYSYGRIRIKDPDGKLLLDTKADI